MLASIRLGLTGYYSPSLLRQNLIRAMSQTAKGMGPIFTSMQTKLTEKMTPMKLEIVDESPLHAGHAAMKDYPSSETHFSALIVSERFDSLSLVQRHRLVYGLLSDEFKLGLHALRLQTLTPAEYERRQASH